MPGTGAQGFLGVALETVAGTYTAPTDFVPIDSESLQYIQETVWRRPIRQSADIVGSVPGNARVEGDLSMEAIESTVALFLHAARTTVVKSGTASPGFTYTFTGSANAVPSKTMSITVVRNGIVFGYTGCVVGSFAFTVEDAQLKFNPTILGRDEATQTLPTPTWATGIATQPYGAGNYSLEVPTGTPITDSDGFEFSVDDSPETQYRLKSTAAAAFVAFGERTVSASLQRDFENRTDYDAFKALTSSSITLTGTKGVDNSISLVMPASLKDSYEVGLSGQGDLTRASISYMGVLDATGKAYSIVVKTQKDITP
jgi:hypothetical protein